MNRSFCADIVKSQGGQFYQGVRNSVSNKYDGVGVLIAKNWLDEGVWSNGSFMKGLRVFSDGAWYYGEFFDNKCHGYGI